MPNLQVFKELKATNSTPEKIEILKKHKNNDAAKALFEAALNPEKLYQFNKMPYEWESVSDKFLPDSNYQCFLQLLTELQTRKVSGNNAKQAVMDVFRRMDKNEYELYSQILLKAPLGVTAKTVNQVWPKLVSEFRLMLAPNEIADITKVRYPLYVQPKLDGYRCIYKQGYMWSRSGKPFANKNIPEYFENVFGINTVVLDGEIYAPGYTFNQLQTIMNKVDAALPSGLKYFIYDCMPVEHWAANKCPKPYSERYRLLNEMVAEIADPQKVLSISNDKVQTSGEVVALYKSFLKRGLEGAMLKDPEGLYRWKRVSVKSGEMLKVKPFKEVDLEITGFYEGKGKHTGKAGGFIVDFNGVAVRVGSGLDDDTREAVWNNKKDYLGKTIEIRYLEVTEDGSLRHPSFIRFREEKD